MNHSVRERNIRNIQGYISSQTNNYYENVTHLLVKPLTSLSNICTQLALPN